MKTTKFVIKNGYGIGWSTAMPNSALAHFVTTNPDFVAAVEKRQEEIDSDETLSFTDRRYGKFMEPDHPALLRLLDAIEKEFDAATRIAVTSTLILGAESLRVDEASGLIAIKEFDGNESWEYVQLSHKKKLIFLGD